MLTLFRIELKSWHCAFLNIFLMVLGNGFVIQRGWKLYSIIPYGQPLKYFLPELFIDVRYTIFRNLKLLKDTCCFTIDHKENVIVIIAHMHRQCKLLSLYSLNLYIVLVKNSLIFCCSLSILFLSAICSNPCVHGACSAPEVCTCGAGYRGDTCESSKYMYIISSQL